MHRDRRYNLSRQSGAPVLKLALPHGDVSPKNRRPRLCPRCAATRRQSSLPSSHCTSFRRRRRALGRLEIFRQSQAYFQRRPEIAQPERTRARASRSVAEKNAIGQRPARSAETRPYYRPRESHLAATARNQDSGERAAHHDERGRRRGGVRRHWGTVVRRQAAAGMAPRSTSSASAISAPAS